MKNSYFKAIYGGVLRHETFEQMHKKLLELTINSRHASAPLLKYADRVAKQAIKLDKGVGEYYGIGLDVLAVAILDLFTKNAVNYKANILINDEIRKDDGEEKENILKTAFRDGRDTGKIFYVASSHKDCAKDHLDYQGKIYIDKNFAKYDTDGEITKYVRANNIRTVQWVTHKPVWFITRPYCRHYFVQYSWNEIRDGKYKIPKRKIGDRDYQTPEHANYEYYRDRTLMLRELYKVRPTQKLKNLILKSRILRDKWKEYSSEN